MKGIDNDYKLSELLSGRRGSADVAINVAVVKFRFSGAVVLTKKIVFDKTYENIGLGGYHSCIHAGYAISLFVLVAIEWKVIEYKY